MPERDDPSGFIWDEGLRRYRSRNGRLVSRAAVRAALDRVVEAAQADVERAARRLVDGTLTLPEFRDAMARSIRAAHTASAAAASGGWRNTPAWAWGMAGRRVGDQYRYLNGLVSDVADGRQRLDGGLVARAAMYGLSGRATFEAVSRRGDYEAGYDEERRVIQSPAPCPECIEYAGWGWQPAGVLPLPTEQCSCRTRCRCQVQRRRRGSVPPQAIAPAPAPGHAEVYFPEDDPDDPAPPGYDPAAEALAFASGLLGMEPGRLTLADLADLSGAGPGARVRLRPVAGRYLEMVGDGPGYGMVRRLLPDPVTPGRATLYNEDFAVDAEARGGGIGRDAFGRQVATAARLGIGRIKTYAAGTPADPNLIGYKVWPRFGYDAPLSESQRSAAARDLAGRPEADAARIGDLMRTDAGRAWWDANGRGAAMEFDLAPGSLSRRMWDAYLARKAAGPAAR